MQKAIWDRNHAVRRKFDKGKKKKTKRTKEAHSEIRITGRCTERNRTLDLRVRALSLPDSRVSTLHNLRLLALDPDPNFLSMWILGSSSDGSSSWFPTTPVDDLDCISGSRLLPSHYKHLGS